MSNLNLWDLAIQKQKEGPKNIGLDDAEDKNDDNLEKEQSYLLICGSKDSGKSSLLMRFQDREEQVKSTIALDYTFCRRSRGSAKHIGHLYELGGGPFMLNLINVPLTQESIKDTAIVLMLDLSKPEELWHTAESILAATKERVNKLLQKIKFSDAPTYEYLITQMNTRIPPNHTDMDSEKKKIISKTLRFMAHTNGAFLHVRLHLESDYVQEKATYFKFYSTKMETLVTRGRALLSHLLFGTQGGRGLSTDYNKPIFIPPGSDSFKDIGAPPIGDGSMTSATNPFELWKSAYTSHFPQKNTVMEVRDDPGKDPQFKEESIDLLRHMKDQELERYIIRKQKEEEQEKKLAIPIPRPTPAPAPKPVPQQRRAADEDDSPNESPKKRNHDAKNRRGEKSSRRDESPPKSPPPAAAPPLPDRERSQDSFADYNNEYNSNRGEADGAGGRRSSVDRQGSNNRNESIEREVSNVSSERVPSRKSASSHSNRELVGVSPTPSIHHGDASRRHHDEDEEEDEGDGDGEAGERRGSRRSLTNLASLDDNGMHNNDSRQQQDYDRREEDADDDRRGADEEEDEREAIKDDEKDNERREE